ncbi:Cytochrome P450 2J2 [Allomyces arbusculus]|nr:Cytochrome P450 2J2 [Allomyces arbusculus]
MFQLGGVGGIEGYLDSCVLEWVEMSHKRATIAALYERVHNGLILNRLDAFKARLDEEKARGEDPRTNRDLCWAEGLLLTMEEDELEMIDIKLLMLEFIFAGMDTTSATLLWVFVNPIDHPTHQTRLHAEIESITTLHRRLPSLDDLDDLDALPHTRAFIAEVVRFAPVASLGLPRQTNYADSLAEYHIPAGTQKIYNVVGIHAATDPDFCTDQWIESGNLSIMNENVTFGAGRRMCSVHLVMHEMVLLVARTMACVGVANAKGGKVDMETAFGLTVLPKDTVHVKATVRGENARELVEKVECGAVHRHVESLE